jgi:transposase-like protein
MTVWRNLQAEKERIERENQQRRVRILGLDGAYVQGWGKKRAVLVAVDMGEGKPVAVGYVNEHDAEAVRRWLDSLVQSLGVKVVVTDDLKTYRVVTKALGVKHQLCQFHVRRWVGRACANLREKIPKEWEWVIDRAQTILKELPEDGAKQLFELWLQLPARRQRGEKYTPLDELRNLLIRMSESWGRYTAFVGDADIPWTNNRTEQVIGRMKMRARTVRGYKSWEGMAAGLLLSGTKLT